MMKTPLCHLTFDRTSGALINVPISTLIKELVANENPDAIEDVGLLLRLVPPYQQESAHLAALRWIAAILLHVQSFDHLEIADKDYVLNCVSAITELMERDSDKALNRCNKNSASKTLVNSPLSVATTLMFLQNYEAYTNTIFQLSQQIVSFIRSSLESKPGDVLRNFDAFMLEKLIKIVDDDYNSFITLRKLTYGPPRSFIVNTCAFWRWFPKWEMDHHHSVGYACSIGWLNCKFEIFDKHLWNAICRLNRWSSKRSDVK